MHRDPHPYRILIVEDNAGDAWLIEEYLHDTIRAPRLSWAQDFAQAEEQLCQQTTSAYEAILLDLTLPDKQGLALLHAIQPIAAEIPIVILTGYADARFAIRSLDEGVSDYLLKDELNATVLYKSLVYSIQRHKYVAELRRSRQQYKDLFQISPQPMWLYDLASLAFLDVNQAAIDKYGYDHATFLAMTLRDLRPVEDLPALEQAVAATREDPQRTFKGTFTHQRRDGSRIQVEIHSSPFRWQGRDARLVLAHDITERHNYITAIEQRNQRLREIAWTQAHLVRAPLARIIALVDLMKEMPRSSPEFQAYFTHLEGSSIELDHLIREMIDKTDIDFSP